MTASCPVCSKTFPNRKWGRAIRRCPECLASARAMKGAAHLAVAKAIKKGQLARPASLPCVDGCGYMAQVYDHRDYTKPLVVEPVCMGCNAQRGPAYPFIEMVRQ